MADIGVRNVGPRCWGYASVQVGRGPGRCDRCCPLRIALPCTATRACRAYPMAARERERTQTVTPIDRDTRAVAAYSELEAVLENFLLPTMRPREPATLQSGRQPPRRHCASSRRPLMLSSPLGARGPRCEWQRMPKYVAARPMGLLERQHDRCWNFGAVAVDLRCSCNGSVAQPRCICGAAACPTKRGGR